MLKVVGKYISGSGTDKALTETKIYEPTTMEHIKAEKRYKRCFEAMLTIYLALYSFFFLKKNRM